MLTPDYISGLSVLGGEPFEPANQPELLDFITVVKETLPTKDIWVFTGFTLEELLDENAYPRTEHTDKLLSLIDVMVDGRFEEDKKDISLKFRGSSNQRILDVKASLKNGVAVIIE
jgi:anaerobic ribonucleoside-triphosphate reductase activating protein